MMIMILYDGVNLNVSLGNKTTGRGRIVSNQVSYDSDFNIYKVTGNYRLCFTVDTLPGNSGGPLYTTKNNLNTLIGVVSNESPDGVTYNYGVRINTNILQFIYNNDNLN